MKISFRLETDPEVVTKLVEPVQNLHAEKHPDIFIKYDYDRMLPWYRKMMKQEDVFVVIALSEDKAIGYVLMIHHTVNEEDNPFQVPGYNAILIDQMCIIPEYQRQGNGSKLMDFALDFCKKKEVQRVQLKVWTDNEEAKIFYRKRGFTCKQELHEICL
jgi:diamine N-acetyltransferase